MRKQFMYLVRGLPGSGKTTLAEALTGGGFSADDFFVNDAGVYNYDPSQIKDAHQDCQTRCADFLKACKSFPIKADTPVSVHNTFSERWEMEPYFDIAESFNYRYTVIDLFDAGFNDEELSESNTHGVRVETIRAMRKRWEHDWKNGNPTPPWERERR